MTEKRQEFMQRINARGVDYFTAARVESERIRINERKRAELKQENEDAKKYLRTGKDLSHPDAVYAAMFASSTLRRDLAETENAIKESERFIKGER